MAKKYFPKALSVGLSLALCASLVAPSFAASFTELQGVIDGETALVKDGNTVIGYENGTVTLYEDVTYQESDGKQTDIKTNGKDIVLDLNGNDIAGAGTEYKNGNGSKSSTIYVNGGSLTLQDNHEGDEPDGQVTGAGNCGVWVDKGSSFTMEGGQISGNWKHDGDPTLGGAGVNVNGGEFTMTGGKITNNTSEANGGGVNVTNGGTFEMAGGEISENHCIDKDGNETPWGNAVSVIGQDSTFTMSGEAVVDGEIFVKLGGSVNASSDRSSLKGEYSTKADNSTGIHLISEALPAPTGPNDTTTVTPVEPEVEIEDVAVPLAAGPVTCAEFIDYLWRHEDEPEADLVVEHEYAEAISWALSIEIIDAETFEADELVTVAAVRDILANFAAYADMDVNVYALITLRGDEDEAVLNCDEVLAEFFGE